MENNAKKTKWGAGVLGGSMLLIVGEAVVSALVVAVYLIIQQFLPENEIFSYKVITGAVLGSAVTLANFLILSISVNRALDGFMEKRGTAEMDEEEAAEFARVNTQSVQNAATRSYLIRMVSMLATLILAFFLEWFDPLATAIPLLMFKPLLYFTEFIKRKTGKQK